MSNQIRITGNLTGAPELKFTQSGKAVASFTIADTPRRLNRETKQWEDTGETLFLRCTAWDRLAEAASELAKGTRVVASGVLKQRSYEHDGQNRTVVEATIQELATPVKTGQAQRQAPASDPWATDGGGADAAAPF